MVPVPVLTHCENVVNELQANAPGVQGPDSWVDVGLAELEDDVVVIVDVTNVVVVVLIVVVVTAVVVVVMSPSQPDVEVVGGLVPVGPVEFVPFPNGNGADRGTKINGLTVLVGLTVVIIVEDIKGREGVLDTPAKMKPGPD